MYSFEPSEEQQMLVDTIRRYAITDLRAKAHDADEEGEFPHKLIEKGWELGFLQASIPEQYGGFGDRSAVTGVLAAEEMAFGDLAGALAVMAPGLFCMPIALAGSDPQKQAYIPEIVENQWQPYTAAFIEPHFDFDANQMRTIAQPDGDGYIIDGIKSYVPFAPDAQAMLVYANLDGGSQGFIVRKAVEGLQIGDRQKLLGIDALPVYPVTLSGVRVAAADRLGGAGGHDFAQILDAKRVAMAGLALGVSRAAFEYARDYAKDREVFGVKVAQKQVVAFMLAEMATEIEAIRLLTWEAAWMLDQNKPDASKEAYLALLGAADMTMMVTDRAVQILGGHGYIREHPVELWTRNGRGFATFNGLAIV